MSSVWTDQRPTKPGFYWWRDTNFPLSGERSVIELEWDDLDPKKWESRFGNTCEWSSKPIAEPQEPRL